MGATSNNVDEAKKGFRAALMAGATLALSYVIASYFFLKERISITWDGGLDLLYIAPDSNLILILPLLVVLLMGYRSMGVVISGSGTERLQLVVQASVVVLLSTAIAASGRVAIYSPHTQQSLPSKYSMQQQGFEHLFLIAGPGGSIWDQCRQLLQLDGPWYVRKSTSIWCNATSGEMELTELGRKAVADKVVARTKDGAVSSLYSYLEIGLIVVSSLLAFGAFLILQRWKVLKKKDVNYESC